MICKLLFNRIVFTNRFEYAKIVIHVKTAIYIKTLRNSFIIIKAEGGYCNG